MYTLKEKLAYTQFNIKILSIYLYMINKHDGHTYRHTDGRTLAFIE